MKASTLAAVTALIAHTQAAMPEIRERCAETTWQKFNALTADAEQAVAAEGETSEVPASVLNDEQFAELTQLVSSAVAQGLADASEAPPAGV